VIADITIRASVFEGSERSRTREGGRPVLFLNFVQRRAIGDWRYQSSLIAARVAAMI
jgi:hypothetical protein